MTAYERRYSTPLPVRPPLPEGEQQGAPPLLLSVALFCRQYGPSRSVAYELLASGALTGVKIGRRTYITLVEAERWLASLPQYQPKQKPGALKGDGNV